MSENKCLRVVSYPSGLIKDSNFNIITEEIPKADKDQIVVKNIYGSIDPTHRIWLSERPQYMENVSIGDVMRAATVGKVIESKNDDYPVGSYVYGFGGLCEYYLGIPGVNVLYPVEKSESTPLISYASIFNPIICMAAWAGVNKILKVSAEDIVVVSGASGAVGSLVGQLSKDKGATVIGVAGGEAKCKILLEKFGFDYAIDYKSQNVDEELKKIASGGITCYFDNVGGKITDDVFLNFKNNGRCALCGTISEYNEKPVGLTQYNMILMRRVSVTGLISFDHIADMGQCKEDLIRLMDEGKLSYTEDLRIGGVSNYVNTVNDLFAGKNTGKLILKIGDES